MCKNEQFNLVIDLYMNSTDQLIYSDQLLTTSIHVKQAVCLECRFMCAVCVCNPNCAKHTSVHNMIFLDLFVRL